MLPEALFDALVEPVLVFDDGTSLRYANPAALRALPVEAGMRLADLREALDAPVWNAVSQAIAGGRNVVLPAGEGAVPTRARVVVNRIAERLWALCLPADTPRPREPQRDLTPVPVLQIADGPLRHVHTMLWGSPFPAMLQDEAFRILDVNPAFAALAGATREQLVGRDPLDLQPEADRAQVLADRERLMRDPFHPDVPALVEQRLVDTQGTPRWLRAARYVTLTQDQRRLLLTLMQESTAEHVARDQAERYSRELDQWFDRSPLGMALFDPSGLVLRANAVFEQLVGGPLVDLREASAEVQALLGWSERWERSWPLPDGSGAEGDSGGWRARDGSVTLSDGRSRWVRALLRGIESQESRGGRDPHDPPRPLPARIMCMLEDRTAEEERDLARLQLGTLAHTAGAGLTTLGGDDHGVVGASPPGALATSTSITTSLSPVPAAVVSSPLAGATPAANDAAPIRRSAVASTALPAVNGGPAPGLFVQGVRRDWVVPASLPEFERLQQALARGERVEARYAIEHPELGLRWLVTRVEPGRTASGRLSTPVVTLDITEQQIARERAEQLLAELTNILESSPAGIASMRGYTLMHCNRRFERMLRLQPGSAVGSDIRAVLAAHAQTPLPEQLDPGLLYEAELEVLADDGSSHWYALSIRRTGPAPASEGGVTQAIAVVSEITRLKAQQVELERLAGERAQLAHVLGQQADRTRAVLDSVLVGIVTVNEQGDISWLNRSARRMFGGDLGDFLGQPIGSVAADDPLHPFRRTLEMAGSLRDGEAVMFECRVHGRDGRTFWVVGNAVNTLGLQGQRELTFALMDIEQRRQAEARIAEARASLQQIIEAAPMAITLCDAGTLAVLQLNRVAAQLCRVPADEAVGLQPEQLFPPETAASLRADLRAALADPSRVTQREYRWLRRGEGTQAEQVWDARFLPLSRGGTSAGEPGQVDQILMVASDVSAQRAAQKAELEAAIAQREMLVQEVHHRIKNNLQGVAGLMQQIAVRRPEMQPFIAEVVGQVQAIAHVYGLQVGNLGALRLRHVMSAIAQSVQRTFGREIELKVEEDGARPGTDWSLPESESIPIALTVNELLTNAIKHSPAGSTVQCRLVCERDGVRIEIANIGRLPDGLRIDHRPSTVSGLGLVRSLLPRRHASFALEQREGRVVATVALAAPVLGRIDAATGAALTVAAS
ncbi:PAS domain S-box protein [Leptothrix sp. BB-4]